MATTTEDFSATPTTTNWTTVRGSVALTRVTSDNSGSIPGQGSGTNGHSRRNFDTGSADMFTECDVVAAGADDNRTIFLSARHTSTNSNTASNSLGMTCYATALNAQAGTLSVLRYAGSSSSTTPTATALVSGLSVTIPATPFKYRIEVEGSTIRAFIGGTQVWSGTDTVITGNTRGGLGFFSAGNPPVARVDNFRTGALADDRTVPVAGGDSATGGEAGQATAAPTGGDTAAGTDSGAITTAAATGGDTAAGAETGQITLPVSGGDTATGTDTGAANAAPTGADTAAGADSGTAAARPAGSDTATGSETGVAGTLFTGSDTATGTETGQTFAATAGGDNTATGSEAGNAGNGGSGTDTALGTDSGTATTATAGGDSGTGLDPTSVPVAVTPSTGDSGTGAETGTTAAAAAGGDTATGSNAPGSSTAAVTGTNPGTGVETWSSTAQVAGADTAATVETGKITTYGSDTATGASTLSNLYADTRGADTATGADGGYVEALDGDIVISIYAIVAGVAVPLPDYQSLTLAPTRNGPGSISLSYPTAGLNFGVLRDNTVGADRDLEVEIWTIGNPLGALRGYLQEGAGDDVKEGRGGSWTFTGGFLELRMAEARVYPQPLVGEATLGPTVTVKKSTVTAAQWTRLTATLGYTPSSDTDPTVSVPQKILDAVKANAATVPVLADPKREAKFVAQTPGAMIGFLLAQARARGALTDITTSFTAERDSNGTPWPTLVTTTISPGSTYEQVLNLLAQLGRAEWSMSWTGSARQLNLWIAGARGVDKSTGLRPVVLRAGRNLPEAPTKWSVRSSPTAMGAAGAEGWYADTTDLNAQARRGRRIEGWTTSQNLQTADAVLAYAQRRLSTNSDGTLEVTHGLALLPGQPRPLVSFNVGDWIYSATGTSLDRYRVVEWSLTINATRQMSATVTLNDAFVDEVIRQRQQLDAISSGEAVTGTSTQPVDSTPPSPPTGLLVSSGAFNEGIDAYAVVLVAWTAPETNVDGSALTSLAGYRVEWTEYANPTKWRAAATVGGNVTQAQFTTAVGLPILVRVSAYKASGAASTWLTLTAPHTTEVDSTPPPQTSGVVGSNYLGVLTWTWDGKSNTGADMFAAAPDFAYAELHVSPASQFTPDATTLQDKLYGRGSYSYAKLPDGSTPGYGVTYYARLVPVDVRGNRQPAASVQGSAVPSKLLGDDVFAGAIGSVALADAAVIRAKIGNLAVGDAQIETLAVGKLTAGLLQANMIVGTGKIATGTTGARVEVDTAGLRLYDPSGNINVQFKTSDGSAMIAGEYRTSLTTGQRLVFNPNGSAPDEVRFYPSSTNQYGRMRTLTSGSTTYPNQAGVGIKAYSGRSDAQSGELAVFPGYARMSWSNEQNGGTISSTVLTEPHQVGLGGGRILMTVSPYASTEDSGIFRMGATDLNGTFIQRAVFSIFGSGGSRDGNVKAGNINRFSYLQYDTGALSVVNDTTWINIGANAFVVNSERKAKEDLTPAPLDPIPAIMDAEFYSYRKVEPLVPGRENPLQLGLVVDEVPDVLRVYSEDHDSWGIDLYGATAILWGGARVHETRIADLEREVRMLRARLDGPRLEAVA